MDERIGNNCHTMEQWMKFVEDGVAMEKYLAETAPNNARATVDKLRKISERTEKILRGLDYIESILNYTKFIENSEGFSTLAQEYAERVAENATRAEEAAQLLNALTCLIPLEPPSMPLVQDIIRARHHL